MVALYSPLTTSSNFGFTFDDDPVSFLLEDFNNHYFTNDYEHHHPKQQYAASSSPSNLDPSNSCWDVDQLIIPPSCTPSIFTDPPPTLPCMSGGEGPRQPSPPAVSSGYSGRRAGPTEEATVAGDYKKKKQNHNASERMRRMRINDLYGSLRALLPDTPHHTKKLSIPNTVDRVVKYIPELQNQVQMLIQRKEQLLPALASTTANSVNFSQATAASNNKSCSATCSCSCSVQATQLGNGEISVQISTPRSLITTLVPISEVVRGLEEEDGLVVIDVSSSESAAGRVFHHFHLMALEGSQKIIKCELLRETLLTRCQKWEELCLWMISQGLS